MRRHVQQLGSRTPPEYSRGEVDPTGATSSSVNRAAMAARTGDIAAADDSARWRRSCNGLCLRVAAAVLLSFPPQRLPGGANAS